jgi:hypothetical protein
VNNQVDFIILNKIRNRPDFPVKSLGTKKSFIDLGYVYANRINDLNKVFKVPNGYSIKALILERFEGSDADHLYDIIVEILSRIAKRVNCKKLQLPKAMFYAPSLMLKKHLRRGPKSKKKNGKEKTNLYLPFGFYKSKKFIEHTQEFSENAKGLQFAVKNTTKIIDLWNKFPLPVADATIKEAGEFIDKLYVESDRLKSMLLANQVKDVSEVIENIQITYDRLCDINWKTYESDVDAAINAVRMKLRSHRFTV